MTIPPKAVKILRLALDHGAPAGEWQGAAVRYVFVLRKAGATVESLTQTTAPSPRRTAIRMPFGRYKGKSLRTIPSDYLAWLLSLANLRPGLRSDITHELKTRTTP
jgi:hypothetical protein